MARSPPAQLYPPSAAFDAQDISVSELHTIHFWQAGKRDGKPVLFVHGGPGGATSATDTAYFDPEVYRVILIDQRGCGKSTPLGELRENTTWDLVRDIETVRETLGIDRWMVFGGSWGSTLALAYAETHPDHVAALILRGIYLSRRSELDFTYKDGANHIYPETWAPFIAHIPENERGDLMAAYYRRLTSTDEAVVVAAAVPWRTWEDSTAKLIPDAKFTARAADDTVAARAGARIEAHYFYHLGFMEDGYLLKEENVSKIRDIPAVAVQGRYDIVCPMRAAYDLKAAWGPKLDLVVVPDAGHSAKEPGTATALKEAADRFAREVDW